MKVRTLIELLGDFDPDRTVVVPWSIPKTTREAAEVVETKMDVTPEEDFIPQGDDREARQSETVVALVPVMRGPYEKREQEKAERQKREREERQKDDD